MGTKLESVLVVEDEEDIRMLVRMSLELAGLAVHDYATGQDALRDVERVAPQLVLCDMMLPGMDGTEVLAALRKKPETAELPFVFLTAKVHPDEVATYKSLGAVAVLNKPFDPVELGPDLLKIWEATGR